MNIKKIFLASTFIFNGIVFFCTSGHSQVVPDNSLPMNSRVILNKNTNIITGGTITGSNLFHSFDQFSVPKNFSVYFNNSLAIQNIIGRVTGNSISNIDGVLSANGTANLFLINPNGIVFGPNVALNIGGSFLASTANSMSFADGTQFSTSTKPSQNTPLLTVSVPIGLGFNTSTPPNPIQVNGYGHNQLIVASIDSPIIGAGQTLAGLRSRPGTTISLVGGQVNFNGGTLTAPSGRIEIGSVSSGIVKFKLAPGGIFLNYDSVRTFQDIQLDNKSLLDASGLLNGDINLRGRNITLTQLSLIEVSNFGTSPSGQININADGNLNLVGVRTINQPSGGDIAPARGVVSQSLSTGQGANIVVSANQLFAQDSGGIATRTIASGAGGAINLNVKDTTRLFSTDLPTPALTVGAISTSTFGIGHGGNVELNTKKLILENGSYLATFAFNSGNGGFVKINASDSIDILGGRQISFNPEFKTNSFWPSFAGALSTSSSKAGDVFINTNSLRLKDGARLDSSALASGTSGNLIINASNSVELTGKALGFPDPTQIVSSTNIVDPFFQQVFNLPNTLRGTSGYIAINTKKLSVRDGGQISVRNDGITRGGTLEINANSINLNQGSIFASAASGEGGNIFLNAQNLQLRHKSFVTASAGGTGSGGNINVNTSVLTALENSNINANAPQGTGGRVNINTQGLFRSTDSTITALGKAPQFNGIVQIRDLGIDLRNSLTPLTVSFVSPEHLIANSCLARRNAARGTFVVTGNGGLPITPYSGISEWETSPEVSPGEAGKVERLRQGQQQATSSSSYSRHKWKSGDPIVEAQGIIVTADGRKLLGLMPQGGAPQSADKLVCPVN